MLFTKTPEAEGSVGSCAHPVSGEVGIPPQARTVSQSILFLPVLLAPLTLGSIHVMA